MRRALVEDGGLSFGEVYITRSWEEDLWGPRWILTHRWRDPGQFLGFCLGEITPRKKKLAFRPAVPGGPMGLHGAGRKSTFFDVLFLANKNPKFDLDLANGVRIHLGPHKFSSQDLVI